MTLKLLASASLLAVLCGVTPALGESLAPGDSYEQMIRELGQPQGYFELEDRTLYLYPAGKVTVVEGVITTVDLKNEAEMAREAKLKEEAARQWEAHNEMKQTRHLEKGQTLKNDKLTDPTFLSLSSGEQLEFWKRFQRDYPEITVTEIVTPLAERFAREQEELAKAENQLKAQQQKINSLEQRVETAEQNAQQARQSAAQASQQNNGYYSFYGTEYPYPTYYPPQNEVVIVDGNGNATVIPPNPRTRYWRSGVEVNGSVGNVNFRYSSGGNRYNNGWPPPRNPIVIVNGNNSHNNSH